MVVGVVVVVWLWGHSTDQQIGDLCLPLKNFCDEATLSCHPAAEVQKGSLSRWSRRTHQFEAGTLEHIPDIPRHSTGLPYIYLH